MAANHRVSVMTNHAPGGKPESVPIARYVFELVNGKIKRFDCYPEGSVILTGVSGR
jgi:hypothetical protein